MPRDINGRGIIDNDGLCEFQTASIANPENKDDFIAEFIQSTKEKYANIKPYLPLPTLPERVRKENVINYVTDLKNVPVGISKDTVEIQYIDFTSSLGTTISAKKFENTIPFVKSLVALAKNISGINIIILDPKGLLELSKEEFTNYYTDNFEEVISKLKDYVEELIKKESTQSGLLIINGVDELMKKVTSEENLEALTAALKTYEKISTVIVETNSKFKNYSLSKWIKNIYNSSNGIWIGEGVNNQNILICTLNRNMATKFKGNSAGYVIIDNTAEQCKLLDFFTNE